MAYLCKFLGYFAGCLIGHFIIMIIKWKKG